MYDFKTFTFGIGAHESRNQGMCIMEAVAYVAGEKHSDSPKCASPVIAAFLRSWNDEITDDDKRRELLEPFIFRMVGTAAGSETELKRSWMAFDWLVRECAPAFLELTPSLKEYASDLSELPELDQHNFDIAVPVINAARDAARDAAGTAARDAAGTAARTAARDAAAARAAAGDAAGTAAWDAAAAWAAARDAASARAAARDAARAAARDAARDAASARAAARDAASARAALQPTVSDLQQSAWNLVDRMIRLTEPQEVVPFSFELDDQFRDIRTIV